MTEVINERGEQLNNVAALMSDIKSIAGTLQTKTAEQGVVLAKADANVEVVKVNAEEAHKEIEEAQGHQKAGGKCMCYLITGILVLCGIVILSTVLGLKGKSK